MDDLKTVAVTTLVNLEAWHRMTPEMKSEEVARLHRENLEAAYKQHEVISHKHLGPELNMTGMFAAETISVRTIIKYRE